MTAPQTPFSGPQPSATAIFYRNIRWLRFVDRFGRKGQGALEYLGGLAELAANTFMACFTRPFYSAEVMHQMDEVGVKSVSITGLTAFVIGMSLALQTAYALAAFGGKLFVGRVVALSLVRELGPVLTALMVSGRVGSGITAELGSMTVTEQVDALRSMGISPIAISDIMSGLSKTFFFGFEIGIIGCWNGLKVEGGAASVGVATTRTVVLASISILVSDFFLTKLFLAL